VVLETAPRSEIDELIALGGLAIKGVAVNGLPEELEFLHDGGMVLRDYVDDLSFGLWGIIGTFTVEESCLVGRDC
jgi:hypothetical protein